MNTEYHQFLERIPVYLAGRMDPKDHAEFEAFARAHPRLRREVDDLRPSFEWLDREFEETANTQFRLSPARRAELLRASRSNVIAFRGNGGTGEQDGRIEAGRIRRFVSRWAAVAAVLAVISYLGSAVGRDATQEQIVPDRIAAVSSAVETAAQPAGRVYVYPPAYGLNRDEPWRLARRHAEPDADQASMIDQRDQFPEWQPASRAVYGLDGPRPYYEFSIAPGLGAI